MLSFKTILHPTDFSQHSEEALRIAASLAKSHGGKLVVLHVSESPIMAYGEYLSSLTPDQRKEETKLIFEKFQDPPEVAQVEHRLAQGNPGKEIVKAAQETNADLIVMGTHGLTGSANSDSKYLFYEKLVGSVADHVLRQARCPVLTVNTPPQVIQETKPRPKALPVG